MSDQFAEIGVAVMEDIINGNTKNRDAMQKKDDETRRKFINSLIEEKEIRKSKIPTWVRVAVDVIDEELMDNYKEQLTEFVLQGPGNGDLMDLSMAVLTALKDSNMEAAVKILCSTDEEWSRFFIQNMAYTYSDMGPDFVEYTLKRELTAEEKLKFSQKREEIARRKNNKPSTETSKDINK